MTDIVKRLRNKRIRVHDLSGVGWEDDPDCREAADEIERLRAESNQWPQPRLEQLMTNDQRSIIDSEFSMITGALTHLEKLWPRLKFENEQQAQWVRLHFHPIWLRLSKLYEGISHD